MHIYLYTYTYVYIYICTYIHDTYIHSPGQPPNGVLDPEQRSLSATSYQYTVIFFSIRSTLLGAKNGQHRNYMVSVNDVCSPQRAPKGTPQTP